MRGPEGLRIAPDSGAQIWDDGSQVLAKVIDIRARKRTPGKIARHEGKHAFLGAKGVGVRSATIIPGPGYLGLVELNAFDARAAAGSHDEEGNWSDLAKIQASGRDVGSAISAAKDGLRGNEEIVNDIAVELEEAGTLNGARIYSIIDEAEKRRKVDRVEVSIIDKGGIRTHFEAEIEKNGVVVLVDFVKNQSLDPKEEV